MNSIELIIRFKNLLYASYDKHVKINEEMYARNSDIKGLIKGNSKEIDDLRSNIVNVEIALQNEIERARNEYNEKEKRR